MGYRTTWCDLLKKAGGFLPGHIIMGNLNPAIVPIGIPGQVHKTNARMVEEGKKLPGGICFFAWM